MKNFFSALTLALMIVTLGAITTAAQSPVVINVTQIDTARFPQVDVYISVTDANGVPVRNIPANAFRVEENGKPVAATATTRSGEQGAVNVVLVIDRSGSMARVGKMDGAKQAAIEFVNQMRPGDRTALVQFDSEIETLQTFTEDKNALVAAIQRVVPRGNTAMNDALAHAARFFEAVPGRKAIIVVTDGMDNASQLQRDGILKQATASAFSIYTIGLGEKGIGGASQEGIDEPVLQELAHASLGEYFYAPNADQLSDLYKQIATRIHNEYKLTYTSTSALRDGVKRAIVVTAPGVGATRTNYNPGGLIPEVEPQWTSWVLFFLAFAILVALFFAPQGIRWATVRTAPASAPKARVRLTESAPAASAPRASRIKIKKSVDDGARQKLPWDEGAETH